MENNTVKYLIGGGIVAFILTVVFVVWRYGLIGIWNLIQKLMLWLLILGAIGIIVFIVIWLFKPKKIDLIAVHKDSIIEACKLNQHPFKQKLYMQAYGDNWSVRHVGEIVGTCMIKAAPKRTDDTKPGKEKVLTVTDKKYEDLLFIAFYNNKLDKVFGSPEVVMGTLDDFSNLSVDIVYLRGMNFAPKLYNILFLSHHWESRHLIDETITSNIYRYTIQENLKELATMMEDAIDASPAHKKKQEIQNIQVLPVPGGGHP